MKLLALDVGTSSVKAAILDSLTAQPKCPIVKEPFALDTPTPETSELPIDRLWRAVATAARRAVQQAGVAGSREDVAGVGLSCMMPGLVLLDARDQPLGPIWTHLDRRSRPAARQIQAAVGDEFLATVGNRPLPGGITVVAYRQRLVLDPYLAHDVRSFLHVNSWLGFHLTGTKAFDSGNASFTGLFNTLTDQRWSSRWCDYFEIEPSWLPAVIDGRDVLGTLRPAVAAELGVPAGVPVKLGVADTSSAMLAADLQPGDLLHVVGTTQVLGVRIDRAVPSPKRLTHPLGVGPAFTQVTHNAVGGAALGWIQQLCFRDQSEQEFFERTIPAARQRPTRVHLDPPFLGGDRLEIEAYRAAFRDLDLTTDRLDLLAGLLESMVRMHRKALENLGQGTSFRRIVLTGGGAEVVRELIPEYREARVELLVEGSLHGVAKLF